MKRTNCVKLSCSALLFSTLSIAHQVPAAPNIIGEVRIQGGNGNACSIIGVGEGTAVYGIDCENDKSQIIFDKVPSMSRIILSARDCSKSTTDQDWWVALQATRRETSSSELSVAGVVNKASSLKPGETAYVYPNIKIVEAKVKSPGGQARCVALSLPNEAPPKNGFVFEPDPIKSASRVDPADWHGRCDRGAMINLYSKGRENFDFQCSGPIEAKDGKAYVPDTYKTIYFTTDDKPVRCPSNMAVMDLLFTREGGTRIPSHIECASFKNPETGKILKLVENDFSQRMVEHNGHNLICEGKSQMGNLVSQPDNLITGIDRTGSGKQLICSTMAYPD